TGATGTADAVYVGFAVVGQIVVEYVGDTLHVQTTGRHVSGHDNVQQTALVAVDHLLTQLLTEVAVQRRGGKPTGFQTLGQIQTGSLGANEDDHGFHRVECQHARYGLQPVSV